MTRSSITLLVLAATAQAHATPASDVDKELRRLATYGEHDKPNPQFAVQDLEIEPADHLDRIYYMLADINATLDTVVVGMAADAKSAWLASDLRFTGDCGGDGGGCGKTIDHAHVTAVMELVKDHWQPVVLALVKTTTARQQRAQLDAGHQLDAIPDQIDPGAASAVKVFRDTIGDPKALAASVAHRNDVLLFGSENGEKYTGAKVATQLAAWKLAFKVHDGVRAGLTASKTVAWVVANVDATPVGKKVKALPYRVVFVYELAGDAWMLVQAQFAYGSA